MPESILKFFMKEKARIGSDSQEESALDRFRGTIPGAFVLIVITVLAEHFGGMIWDDIHNPYNQIDQNRADIASLKNQIAVVVGALPQIQKSLDSVDNRMAVQEIKTAKIEGQLSLLNTNLTGRLSSAINRARHHGYADALGEMKAFQAPFEAQMNPKLPAWQIKPGD